MSEATESVAFRSPAREREADRLGLWTFIASEALLFGAVILTYLVARLHFPHGFAGGAKELSFWLGTINTGILLCSSFTMALADGCADEEAWRGARWLIVATVLLGIVFLGIKGTEYAEELSKGLVPFFGLPFAYAGNDPRGAALFFGFYFTMTGLHALHLAAGILVLVGIVLPWWRTKEASRKRRTAAVALYWHFVDVVWVFLYPLLYLINR
jgi:cytochrome c oxidase subunit III